LLDFSRYTIRANIRKSVAKQPVGAATELAAKQSRPSAAMRSGETAELRETVSHLPSTAEALEVVIRLLLNKGLVTREGLCRKLDSLKSARNRAPFRGGDCSRVGQRPLSFPA
jgi:hypothetical protein